MKRGTDFPNMERSSDAASQGASELKALLEVKAKYYELLYAVSIKHPNETRHETALRYIKQAEAHTNGPEQTSNGPLNRCAE